MLNISELKDSLKPHFKVDNRRLDCLAQLLIALFTVRTVNLVQLAQAMVTGGGFESRYKRLQRFFKEFEGFKFECLSKFLTHIISIKDSKWQLTLDRTNWKWGKANINILMLSIVFGSISIPLMWKFLDKRGSSSLEERIDLIETFIKLFGMGRILEILADREFVGKEWFTYLKNRGIHFSIRIKKNLLLESSKGKQIYSRELFKNLKSNQSRWIKTLKNIYEVELFVVATRSTEGDLVIIATTYEPENAVNRYKLRWRIETLFGFLKTKGFNFESTHITISERLHNMLAVLSIAFCFAYKLGMIVIKIKPIELKKHQRLAKSIFRVGLDSLQEIAIALTRKAEILAKRFVGEFERTNFLQFLLRA